MKKCMRAISVWLVGSLSATAWAGGVWASHWNGITRYDDNGNVLSYISRGYTFDLAVAPDGVWALGGGLVKYDWQGNIIGGASMPDIPLHSGEEASMEYVDGTLWMMSMNHPEIYRVDANTGQVLPTIRTPYTGISDLLFAGGAVWVSYKPGGVARYSTDGQFLGFLTTGETHADLWRSDDRVNALRSGAIFTSYFLDGTYAGTGSLGVGTGLYSEVSVVRSGSTTWVADGSLDIYRVTPHGLEFSDAQGSETDLVAIPSPGVGAFGLAAGLMALAPTRRQATNL